MAYKAVITNVSDIDVSGRMSATFDLKKGSNVLYTIVVDGQADGMAEVIQTRATELARQVREGKKLKVGDSMDIEE